ncbi:MAG: aminopeptidase P family protein [Planctomycetes bacterium]|nr:aminopeptidase P family protein [Planctomycetota bacterium]
MAQRESIRADHGENVLIIGESETDADLYYATRFLVSVTVMYLEAEGKKTLLVNDLEYGRAGAEAEVDEIVSTTPYEDRLRAADEPVRLTTVLDLYLRERGIRSLTVPAGFPAAHAERLRERGYVLKLRDDPFFPARTVKRPDEIRAIEDTQLHNEAAMDLAVSILRESEIRGDLLYHGGKVLTAERLRLEIQRFLLERDCLAAQPIVAGGDQGADPHTRGSGPLPAHKTIILDIFPRSLATLYWGDMTRTVVRGKATPEARKLYRDVLDAQDLAFSLLKDGAEGHKVHEEVSRLFKDRGNANEEVAGKKTGFIHSTGHGIGLDIHESPRIGKIESRIAEGQVVTVEPGLYYPGVGAVRLEDTVVITKDGCRNLNVFPKVLEI